MPKYTVTVSIQVDVDTDEKTAIRFNDDPPGYVEATDWDGEEISEDAAAEIDDLLPSLDWSKVLQDVAP